MWDCKCVSFDLKKWCLYLKSCALQAVKTLCVVDGGSFTSLNIFSLCQTVCHFFFSSLFKFFQGPRGCNILSLARCGCKFRVSPPSIVGGMSPDGNHRSIWALHSSRQLCLSVSDDRSLPNVLRIGCIVLLPRDCSSHWMRRQCFNVLFSHETAGFIRLQPNPKTSFQVLSFLHLLLAGNNWIGTGFTYVNKNKQKTDQVVRSVFYPSICAVKMEVVIDGLDKEIGRRHSFPPTFH